MIVTVENKKRFKHIDAGHFLIFPLVNTMASSSDKDKGLREINGEHRLRSENLAFDIDVWYRRLASKTFRTVFQPMEESEGRAIREYYNDRFNARGKLSEKSVEALLDLEERLDRLIQTHFSAGGAFLRLCGRSPKDAEPLNRQCVRESYLRNLADLRLEYPSEKVHFLFLLFLLLFSMIDVIIYSSVSFSLI